MICRNSWRNLERNFLRILEEVPEEMQLFLTESREEETLGWNFGRTPKQSCKLLREEFWKRSFWTNGKEVGKEFPELFRGIQKKMLKQSWKQFLKKSRRNSGQSYLRNPGSTQFLEYWKEIPEKFPQKLYCCVYAQIANLAQMRFKRGKTV